MHGRTKRLLLLLVKLAATALVVALIFRNLLGRDATRDMLARLRTIDLRWFFAAIGMQVGSLAAGSVRFDRLLIGQGIRAPMRHIVGTMLVGRFFGAATPGGIGLQGYKIFDVASRTGKHARAAATVGIEVLTGWLGFALVIGIGATVFGRRYVGTAGIVAIDCAALALLLVVTFLLAKPRLFQAIARRVLGDVPTRVQPLVDAVCAYEGKGLLLLQAIALSTTIQVCHSFVYVCAARSLGLPIRIGEVFFVTSVQMLATLLPITINGVGVREATGARLYGLVGVPPSLGVLVPFVGFAAEMAVSLLGGLVLLARGASYSPVFEVDDEGREDVLRAKLETLDVELPTKTRGFVIGLASGLFAGMIVGLGEGAVVLASGSDVPDYGVLWYGVVLYAAFLAPLAGLAGFSFAAISRLIHRPRTEETRVFAGYVSTMVAVVGFGIGAFRLRRDLFHDELVWQSKQGALVLGCAALIAAASAIVISALVRTLVERRPFRFLMHFAGTPLFVALVVASLVAYQKVHPVRRTGPSGRALAPAPEQAGSVLVIVVDALRADHLPAYGYSNGRTPNLDAFARDAVRFDRHFANASSTRPSFASILTGRHPSSHSVTSSADALPDGVVTLPEALAQAGYYTAGVVTSFHLAPFFNFQQGFDEYTYLEPNVVLGANDAQAKLLLAQALRRLVERFSPARPGSTYQDAAAVNRSLSTFLARAPNDAPFFLLAAYMDPHEPYFEHPYRGPGYARGMHPAPRADETARLVRLYDGEITYWDAQFGRLVAELKARGLYDRLTIVVTSDHGEEFHEHGGFWHGSTLYDEQVRVPLFVKLPSGVRAGAVVSEWSQSIDLMPSLLGANDVPSAEGVQGRSDLLDPEFVGTTDVFAEETQEDTVLRSLRARRGSSELKLLTANAGNPRGLPELELYRIDRDPDERVDVANDERDVASLVSRRLLEAEATAREGRVVGRRLEVSTHRDECERMKALGYVRTCTPESASAP